MRRLRRVSAAFFLAFASAPPLAVAQQYGQWSWDGAVGAGLRSYRNVVDLVEASSDDERSLELSLGLTGFLGHPALGRFNLAGTAGLVDYNGVRSLDTRRVGFNAGVTVLPQGRFPTSLYGSRQLYTYSRLTTDDPLLLFGIPEASTSYGGRLRLRSGPLRGTLLGYDYSSTDYREEEASTLQQTAFADWARTGTRFNQHLRLEQHRQHFGLVDYRIDDLTGNFDQRAQLGAGWRWELTAFGVRRRLDYGGSGSTVDNASTSQHLMRSFGSRANLDLGYDGGVTQGAGSDFRSHTGTARLLFRPDASWTVTPYAGYGVQAANRASLRAPQAGLSASWTRTGMVELVVNGGAGLAWLQRDAGPHDSSVSLSLGVSASHGEEGGLRKEAEATITRNTLRRAGELIEGLPDLGAGLAGLGTEDVARGRLTLRRRLSWSLSLYGYGEASRRTFTDPAGAADAVRPAVDTLTGTLQLAGRRGAVSTNVGSSQIATLAPQDVRFWATSLTFRPMRVLSLTASYRGDRREVALAPSADTDRFEASADLLVGAIVLRGQAFRTTERLETGPERRNQGLTLTLSRRFGGWLPVITGPPTGGIIR